MKNLTQSSFIRNLLIGLLLILFTNWLPGQCPIGSVVLTTQQQVNDFASNYPGCANLTGDLTIGPSTDIVDLNGLGGITQIAGSLTIIGNSSLTEISGLGNVTQLGSTTNFIKIGENENLIDCDLSNASATDLSYISVFNNKSLLNLELPMDISNIVGNLQIEQNPLLGHLSEQDALVTIGGFLELADIADPILPEFPNLEQIGGLFLRNCPNITSHPPFSKLSLISMTANYPGYQVIQIHNNDALLEVSLQHVSAPSLVKISVYGNATLERVDLPLDINTIVSNFQIEKNPLLGHLSEHDALVTIGGFLELADIADPILPEFPNLEQIGGLFIRNCPNITSHPPFSKLSLILMTANWPGYQVIQIHNNDALQEVILQHVSAPSLVKISVYGNATLERVDLPLDINTIVSNFQIEKNPLLGHLSEHDALVTIGGFLEVANTVACELPDFPNLELIGTSLYIRFNQNISSLPRFSNSTLISDGLFISENPSLSYCSVEAACNFLQTSGTRSISNNLGSCLNEVEVITSCINNPPYPVSDVDNDGFSSCEGDCDDNEDTVFPGATEICDGLDNNCDGQIDEGFDLDGDGFSTCNGDCDDADPSIHPDATENCDGIDNNCDGLIDEGFDADLDGIADCFDNCPNTANADQSDVDCDGVGDFCDQWDGCDDTLDADGDGIPNCADSDESANWFCGNNGNKVTICHIPPENPGNPQELCISANSLTSHLAHGDYLGPCWQVSCGGSARFLYQPKNGLRPHAQTGFTLYPNPAKAFIILNLETYLGKSVVVIIMDQLGRQVKKLEVFDLQETALQLHFNDGEIPDGVYLCTVRTNLGQESAKFLIARN